jgi:hypothetical protein
MRIRSVGTLYFELVAAVAAVVVLVCCLPHRAYIQYQSMSGTIYNNVQWIYDRITSDPTPIDVAIVGPSRSLLGISAHRVALDLRMAGEPANVANLSVLATGRDLQWVLIERMLKSKSPKAIVVSIDETPDIYGHPAFRYIATASDVIAPPNLLLHNYLPNLFFLPFRQAKLAIASVFPDTFGFRRHFSWSGYQSEYVDYSSSFTRGDGHHVDMERKRSAAEILAEKRKVGGGEGHKSLMGSALAKYAGISDDASYVNRIAAAARARNIALVFVYMPKFGGSLSPQQKANYDRLGSVLDLSDLSSKAYLYSDWAHLNHWGAMLASDRLAVTLAVVLQASAHAGAKSPERPT